MAKPLLCVTVEGRTSDDLRQRRDAVTDADLVELRVDGLATIDMASLLADRRLPVIVTCRPVWEGGRFDGSEEERARLLAEAQALGAEYVDVEWQAGFRDVIGLRGGEGVIVSSHDFTGVPSDLRDRFHAMRQTGAEVVKLAVRTERLSDVLPLLALRDGSRFVLLGMGPSGVATRLLAARFGCAWTYAGERTDLGQIGAGRMLNEFRFRRVSEATPIYGLVGAPLAHSVSPAMHNAGFDAIGLDAVYIPLEAVDVGDFVDFTRVVGVEGVSVTAPFKQVLYDLADEVDDVSRRVGAVNTLRREGPRWIGTNTDVPGFLTPLGDTAFLEGARVVVLGTGGAARAVAVALAPLGARVQVCGRNRDRASAVASLAGGTGASLPPRPGTWDVLVNTTPVGTSPGVDESPMAGQPLDGRLVYDLVYNPNPTRLMRDARAAGCQTIGGLDMLIAQAQRQFQWWTGHRPATALFREAAVRCLEQLVPATSAGTRP